MGAFLIKGFFTFVFEQAEDVNRFRLQMMKRNPTCSTLKTPEVCAQEALMALEVFRILGSVGYNGGIVQNWNRNDTRLCIRSA